MQSLITTQKPKISEICKRYNVRKLELFGSAVTENGFNEAQSDFDFAVEFLKPRKLKPLDEFFGLKSELTELLGRPIDLVELSAVKNPYILKSIEDAKETVFAA